MFIKTLLLAASAGCAFTCWAQHVVHSVSGYVLDASSLEPLIGAYVLADASGSGTTSNAHGFYQLRLSGSQVTLKASFVGYETSEVTFTPSADTVIQFRLKPSVLEEVVVTARLEREINQSNRVVLPIQQAKALPAIGGEVDIMKTLTLLPGISAGVEGSAGVNVRGGSPDQNLILLDDAPVYNVSHLFGFVSVFNADAIKHTEVLKGGFPARHGGRLSSVINIAMKEGNKQHTQGEATIGLISSKLTVETPLKKERTSLLLSGRSAYLDLFTIPQRIGYSSGKKNALISYSMYDVNAKLHHLLQNHQGSVSLSHYSGRDAYQDRYRMAKNATQDARLQWGNYTTTLRYNRLLGQRFFTEGIVYHTRYQFENQDETNSTTDGERQQILVRSGSGIEDISAKVGIGFAANARHQWYGGMQYIYHQYTPAMNRIANAIGDTASTLGSNTLRSHAHETAIFIEDEWQISPLLQAHLGLRHSAFFFPGKSYSGLEPRASLQYELRERFQLTASYSYMRQYLHLLTSNSVGPTNDLWVPATRLAPPQTSWITTLGLNANLSSAYTASAELFYKEMNHLIDYEDGQNPAISFDQRWDELVETGGNGLAYGSEFFLQKNEGKVTGWISYTLSWNTRQFDQINGGKRYPYRYDRRHQVALVGNYRLNDKWSLAGNWIYTTGFAVTAPVAMYHGGGQTLLIYGDRNNARMPHYHRLDVAFTKSYATKRQNLASWSWGVYNVYMRRNPLYLKSHQYGYTQDFDRGMQIYTDIYGPAYFLFVPSVSYSLKF